MIINIQFMKNWWNPENIGGGGEVPSQLPESTTCTKYNTENTIVALEKY